MTLYIALHPDDFTKLSDYSFDNVAASKLWESLTVVEETDGGFYNCAIDISDAAEFVDYCNEFGDPVPNWSSRLGEKILQLVCKVEEIKQCLS